jgi:hypothetical protein
MKHVVGHDYVEYMKRQIFNENVKEINKSLKEACSSFVSITYMVS